MLIIIAFCIIRSTLYSYLYHYFVLFIHIYYYFPLFLLFYIIFAHKLFVQ